MLQSENAEKQLMGLYHRIGHRATSLKSLLQAARLRTLQTAEQSTGPRYEVI